MEEQLLQEVANFTKDWIKDQIKNRPFDRPNKVGGVINPSPRRIQGSGRLYDSVDVVVEDGDILVYMEFYGSDILFGEGRRAQPQYRSGEKIDIVGIPPVDKIRGWMRTVPSFQGLSEKKMRGISYAIAINIAKRGIGALNLFNLYDEEVFEVFEEEINKLIEEGDFQGLGLDVEEILDRIVLLSNDTLDLTLE
jgi:hypothetical protein